MSDALTIALVASILGSVCCIAMIMQACRGVRDNTKMRNKIVFDELKKRESLSSLRDVHSIEDDIRSLERHLSSAKSVLKSKKALLKEAKLRSASELSDELSKSSHTRSKRKKRPPSEEDIHATADFSQHRTSLEVPKAVETVNGPYVAETRIFIPQIVQIQAEEAEETSARSMRRRSRQSTPRHDAELNAEDSPAHSRRRSSRLSRSRSPRSREMSRSPRRVRRRSSSQSPRNSADTSGKREPLFRANSPRTHAHAASDGWMAEAHATPMGMKPLATTAFSFEPARLGVAVDAVERPNVTAWAEPPSLGVRTDLAVPSNDTLPRQAPASPRQRPTIMELPSIPPT